MFTEDTHNGLHGAHAQPHVEEGATQGHDHALTLHLTSMEGVASIKDWDLLLKQSLAITISAQVSGL